MLRKIIEIRKDPDRGVVGRAAFSRGPLLLIARSSPCLKPLFEKFGFARQTVSLFFDFSCRFIRFPHGGENYLHNVIEKPVEVLRA